MRATQRGRHQRKGLALSLSVNSAGAPPASLPQRRRFELEDGQRLKGMVLEGTGEDHVAHRQSGDPERSHRMSRTAFLLPLARLLMSSLFVWDGILQLRNPSGTAQYFASVHVPAPLVAVWISIPVHLLGGLALLAGFYSRCAAALLALVCLGT